MNYNLVTKLKMQCFNSLFHCKAADLFNQHSKYVCSSFHARSRSSSWELIFLLLSTYCCLDMRKNHLFLSLLSNQTETKGTSVHIRCYSPPKELLWRGAGHDGSVPTAPCCPLSWSGQNPPQSLSPSPSQNLIPWKQGFLPQGYLGRGVLSPWGGAGAELRALPGHAL